MNSLNAAILMLPFALATATAAGPEAYHVVWDSPSKDHHGSMPLGNGDISTNAWIEPSGALVFYIGKTDSWGDNARLLKIGKIRVTLDPAPAITPFRQELSLADGTLKVSYGDGTVLLLWVDSNHPLVHVDIASTRPVTATATAELWRTAPTTLPSLECSDVMTDRSQPKMMHGPTVVEPDTLLTGLTGRIGWFHHNTKSVGPAQHAETQGTTGYQRVDPLLHRTFGAVITADHAKRLDDTRLQSPAATAHHFAVHVLTRHPASPDAWQQAMDTLITSTARIPRVEQRRNHETWWRDFWKRSWIHISPNATSPQAVLPPNKLLDGKETATTNLPAGEETAVVSGGYALQRFITAAAGRGSFPIKFNGSIFTVPFAGAPGDADYRKWGPGYWWQNTRLPYLSLCASGDFEMLEPLFHMYVDELLPFNQYRTRRYFGFEGAYYAECIHFWGDVFNESYGWTPMEKRKDPLQQSGYHKWEWVAGPELVWMMLDAYAHTGDEKLLTQRILPTADAVIRFFDNYYKTNEQGQLVMHPSQALETWWDCTNPMPELAGLKAITARLLELPPNSATPAARSYWQAFAAKLAPLPTRDVPGGKALAPATKFAAKKNCENPELYAVFPFRLCSFEQDNRGLGLLALEHRWDRGHFGWRQDDLFMAYLGLAGDARKGLVTRARSHDTNSRFPAFWGPNFDWVPDQDHGAVLMKTTQAMLLQSAGDRIFLCPAWPREWDADFRLHAPGRTVVEGTIKGGRLTALAVTPAVRKKDIILPAGWTLP